MRRTKNCVFQYRVENVFRWGDGTAVSAYSENRERKEIQFEVSFGVRMEQLRSLAEHVKSEDVLLQPVISSDTDILVLVRGAQFD